MSIYRIIVVLANGQVTQRILVSESFQADIERVRDSIALDGETVKRVEFMGEVNYMGANKNV